MSELKVGDTVKMRLPEDFLNIDYIAIKWKIIAITEDEGGSAVIESRETKEHNVIQLSKLIKY